MEVCGLRRSSSVSARKAQAAMVASAVSGVMLAWAFAPRDCVRAKSAAMRAGSGLDLSAARLKTAVAVGLSPLTPALSPPRGEGEAARRISVRCASRRVRWLGFSSSFTSAASVAFAKSGSAAAVKFFGVTRTM